MKSIKSTSATYPKSNTIPKLSPRVEGMIVIMALMLVIVIVIVSSCSHGPHINPEGPFWMDDDNKGISESPFEEPPLVWTILQRTTNDQVLELLDVDRNIRKIAGNPTQAKNTNCFDEVPNSSWFTNRHGLPQTRLTLEQIQVGPNLTEGPDIEGIWEVFRPKVGGATPGFWIEDSRGDQYIIKFDPADNPEMATAAAAMGSRYFHACGFNAPQETIVYWRKENLSIREGVTIKDRSGKKRPLTMEDINKILDNAHAEPDGTIRSLASLNIGNVKGPFMYKGTRKNDPNDWCPHEHRRELRGLYVIGSLVNHYDLKDHNSMDVYVGEDGSGYLKHYLMDFGSTFGSDGHQVKAPRKGHANTFDVRDVGVSMVTFGLKTWAWQDYQPHQYPSIGYFESEIFEPDKFDPINPNSAFEQLTYQDAYWGAKIVMAFSKGDLQAIVDAGHYSNSEAEAYLLKTLLERREKIGRHWFGKVNPLDFPSIENSAGSMGFTFHDLAVDYGLEENDATYRYQIRHNDNRVLGPTEVNSTMILIGGSNLQSLVTRAEEGPAATQSSSLYELTITTQRGAGKVSKPAIFWLRYDPTAKQFSVVGIEHPG